MPDLNNQNKKAGKNMNQKKSVLVKRTIKILSVLVLCSTLWTGVLAQERSSVLLGYIVIPDISATMDRLSEIGATVDPAVYNREYFRSKAGSLIGDPELSNIKKGMPVVLMLFQNTGLDNTEGRGINHIEYAAVVPAVDREKYVKSLQEKNIPFEVNDDRVIISDKNSSLFFAQREMKFYREISRQANSSDFRVMVKIDSFMSVYNSTIEATLGMLQAINSMNYYSGGNYAGDVQLAMGKFFIYGLLDLASQSKGYQLDVSFNNKEINFYSEYSAIPGSDLSRFFDGDPQVANKSLSLLPGKGQLTYAGYFDMKRFRDLVESLIAHAVKRDPSLENYVNRELIDAYMAYTNLYSGDFAVTYGFNASSRLEVNVAAATGSNSADHIQVNEKFMSIYSEVIKKYGGSMSGFTGYTLQKNYRKSNGIDVHRYVMNMDTSKMSDAEKEMMEKMLGKEFSMEFAVSNGYIAASTSPENLDRIISNTVDSPAGTDLLSMKAFGPGMGSYIDMDLIGFFEKIIEIGAGDKTEKNPSVERIEKMLKALDTVERNILFSTKYSKGVSYSRCRISTKMITDFIKVSKEQSKADTEENGSGYDEPLDEGGE